MAQPARATERQIEVLLRLLADAEAAVAGGRPLDALLADEFRGHREFGSRDRRLFSEALFAAFRWKGALEAGDVRTPADRLALAWHLDARPPAPAIDKLSADLPDLGATLARLRALPASALVPAWLGAALLHPEGVEASAHFERTVRSFQQRPPTWLRCRQGRRDEVVRLCREAGGEPIDHPELPDAVGLVRSIPLAALHRASGAAFEVQDASSQLVGLQCAPHPGEAWWDVCAGAGGKALHLADLLQNRGRILATDVRNTALAELARRARAAGAASVAARRCEPEAVAPGSFDGVLVDAPCSGVGTWSRNPDMRWRTPATWVAEKAAVQLDLLARAAPAVRTGGRLVYAVCTVTRAETADVAAAFLASHPEFTPASTRQVWPWEGPGDGMFIASFRRRGGHPTA